MSKSKLRIGVAGVYAAAAFALYLAFLIGDGRGGETTWIKYAVILMTLAFSLFDTALPGRAQLFLIAAFVFTATADWFLLVQNDGYLYGVSAFAVVQLMHFARLCVLRGVKPWKGLSVRVVLFAVVAGTLAGLGQTDPVFYMTAFYIVTLCGNAAEAFLLARRDKRYYMLAAGFVLFVCCDVFVGLNYLDSLAYGRLSFGNLSWVFYAPSQVLIALSGLLQKREVTECVQNCRSD